MCTPDCFRWVARNLAPEEVAGCRILEVGSRDVNGSLRHVFEMLRPAGYVGTDIEPGEGVDKICSAYDLWGIEGRVILNFTL